MDPEADETIPSSSLAASGAAAIDSASLAASGASAIDAASFAASGAAVSGGAAGDPTVLAPQLDDVLDAMQSTLDSATDISDAWKQADALIDSADMSVDILRVMLGVPDDDETITPPPDANANDLAASIDASLDAAVTAVSSDSDALGLLDQLTQASDLAGQLLDAMGDSDPDAAPEGDTGGGDEGMTAHGAAFAEGDPPPAGDLSFTMPIMVLEGVDTGDGRYIKPEALSWRELPIPVMAITETGFGHEGAQLVGHITSVERIDASGETNPKTGEPYGSVDVDGAQVPVQALKATGDFASMETATQVADLVRGQFLRGVSVDLSDVVSEIELLDEDGTPQGDDELDLLDALFFDGDMREVVTEGRVMGATVCPFPAFEGAYIEMGGGVATPALQASAKPSESYALHILDEFGSRDCEPCTNGQPIVASAGPMAPPAEWFQDPGFEEITALTITPEGRVFGHLAVWGTCHTGHQGRCVTPPKSKADYAYFRTGAVRTADGSLASCGQITMGTGHADIKLSPVATLAHYDNTGTAVADITTGEDGFGIWFTGAMRPDVTELQVRQLQASGLSGDWRMLGGHLELLAALAVNVQGYPVTRARTASGGTMALTAAGAGAVIREAHPAAAIEALTRWQNEMAPFFQGMLDREARQIQRHELQSRADRLRRRVHTSR